ncbi:hypothetical protein LLS1_18620 [Leifsonia sp. LS1]|nr:hypothetical protein LLS1_18620 [Leifsonia sp. LS1]
MGDPVAFRAVVLDTDDLVDIADFAIRQLKSDEIEPTGPAQFLIQDPKRGGDTRSLEAAAIPALTPVEKSRISIFIQFEARGSGGSINIELRRGMEPTVVVNAVGDLVSVNRIRDAVVGKILDGTKPVPQWSRIAHLVALIPALVLTVAMIAVQATTTSVALSIFGWTLTALAVTGTVIASRTLRTRLADHRTGCRVLNETRDARTTRQTDERTKIKTALVTTAVVAPITIAATLLTTWLTGALHLN